MIWGYNLREHFNTFWKYVINTNHKCLGGGGEIDPPTPQNNFETQQQCLYCFASFLFQYVLIRIMKSNIQ